jgi:hypothetical protein
MLQDEKRLEFVRMVFRVRMTCLTRESVSAELVELVGVLCGPMSKEQGSDFPCHAKDGSGPKTSCARKGAEPS